MTKAATAPTNAPDPPIVEAAMPSPAEEQDKPTEPGEAPPSLKDWDPNLPRLGLPVIFKSLDGARDWMGQNEFAATITKVRKSEAHPDQPVTVDLVYFPPHRSHVHLGPVKHEADIEPTDTMCWAVLK